MHFHVGAVFILAGLGLSATTPRPVAKWDGTLAGLLAVCGCGFVAWGLIDLCLPQ